MQAGQGNIWTQTSCQYKEPKIHAVFLWIGFRGSGAHQYIYGKVNNGNYVYVCIYVDDMIIADKTSKNI